MNNLFAETLKKLRAERGLSQIQLGEQMFVNQSTVARWESGSRLPDATMITRLSVVLDVDVSTFMPDATITDFIWPQEAIEYAKMNQIALAILDIELGTASGLDLCRTPWNRHSLGNCSLWSTMCYSPISACRR